MPDINPRACPHCKRLGLCNCTALPTAEETIRQLRTTKAEQAAALSATNAEQAARIELYRMALEKISAIRDGIVGKQGFNFSEHAYPLVAALDAAGFPGVGHKIASKNLGTLIEQRDKAEAEAAELRATNAEQAARIRELEQSLTQAVGALAVSFTIPQFEQWFRQEHNAIPWDDTDEERLRVLKGLGVIASERKGGG